MMGISTDNIVWIRHFLFTISRNNPKINLQRLIIKNEDTETKRKLDHSEHFSVSGKTLSFRSGRSSNTVFIKPVITSVWLNLFRFLFSC
jgi:hypothetical protein